MTRALRGHAASQGRGLLVARSDRGENKQVYHINLVKRWNDVVPVAFASTLLEREELGPEVPGPGPIPPVGRGENLSGSQARDVAGLQPRFVTSFRPCPVAPH